MPSLVVLLLEQLERGVELRRASALTRTSSVIVKPVAVSSIDAAASAGRSGAGVAQPMSERAMRRSDSRERARIATRHCSVIAVIRIGDVRDTFVGRCSVVAVAPAQVARRRSAAPTARRGADSRHRRRRYA